MQNLRALGHALIKFIFSLVLHNKVISRLKAIKKQIRQAQEVKMVEPLNL